MNSAEFQSAQAALAVDAVSRALSELPAEKLNLLSSTMATAAKSLLARRSDKDAGVGGQSTIPVSFTVDVQRRVVRSEQITFDLQRTITNSVLETSAVDELKEWLLNTGDSLYDALRVRLPLLVPIFVAWANNLEADGRVDEYNTVMSLVIFLIVLINPQGKR